MSVSVGSRSTYSNPGGGADPVEKKQAAALKQASAMHDLDLRARSYPWDPALRGSDYNIRNRRHSSPTNGMLPSELNLVPEQRRSTSSPNQGFPNGSPRQALPNIKRLIPMAKPRTSVNSVLNDLPYDIRATQLRRARQILHERYKNRLTKAAALGLQRGSLPSGGRHSVESLLMRMHANGGVGRKKILGEWDRNASLWKMARQYKKQVEDLKMLREAHKYRQEIRRDLLTNAEVRRMIEREAALFGEMCSRMDPEVVENREVSREPIDHRGRPLATTPIMAMQFSPEQQRQYKEQVLRKPESIGGTWVPPAQGRVTRLPQAPLVVDDVDDRQLVAKQVPVCIQNLRNLLQFAKEVLILAESDFSFSSALVEYMPEDSYIVATSFDCEEKLQELHKDLLENHLKILRDHKATILHEVDACQIEETLEASIRKKSPEEEEAIRSRWSGHFDLVWIQLPHTGGTAKTNSTMIQRFLDTVGRALKPNGLVFMTLYGMQVDHWKVTQHAQAAEMVHVFKVPFNTSIYPAIWTMYNPKVGFSDGYFDILRHPCDTFVFAQTEFTCVSKLKTVDSKILSGLRTVKINTIADLAEADKRLLSDDVDPKFIRLIHQAKDWLNNWIELLTKVPGLIQSLPLLDAHSRGHAAVDGGRYTGSPIYY